MSEERRVAPAEGYSAPAIGTAVPTVPSDEALIDDEYKHLSPSLAKKFRMLRDMPTAPRTSFSSRVAVPSVRPDIEGAERDADAFAEEVLDAIHRRLMLSNGNDSELKAQLAERDARIAERDARIAEKDARLKEKDARIGRLENNFRLLAVRVNQTPASFAPVPPDSDEEGEEDARGGDQLFDPDSGSEEENRDGGYLSGVGLPS